MMQVSSTASLAQKGAARQFFKTFGGMFMTYMNIIVRGEQRWGWVGGIGNQGIRMNAAQPFVRRKALQNIIANKKIYS